MSATDLVASNGTSKLCPRCGASRGICMADPDGNGCQVVGAPAAPPSDAGSPDADEPLPEVDGNEWYTPPSIIKQARTFLGRIDLDPASCATAQEVVKATRYFSKDYDGLAQEWHGRVWLNPPYSHPEMLNFVTKLIGEYECGRVKEALLLSNSSTDSRWFRLLAPYPAVALKDRLRFWHPQKPDGRARIGQMLTYLGPRHAEFKATFGADGRFIPADVSAEPMPSEVDERWDELLADCEHLRPLVVVGARRLRDLAQQPIEWAWKDYAVAGTINGLAGPPSGGKTTLLFLLLLARAATGEPVELLQRRVVPAPTGRYVVLIEGEHGDKSAARKLVSSAELLGLGDDALNRIILVARKNVLVPSAPWLDVVKLIAAGLVGDIGIDTLARCTQGDANSEQDQVEIFAELARAIEKAPVDAHPTVWTVMHTRKKGADALEDVSGSAQRVGQSDAVIMVSANREDGASSKVTSSTIKLVKAREDPEDYPPDMLLTLGKDRVSAEPETSSGRKGGAGDRRKVYSAIEKKPGIGAADLRDACGIGDRADTVVAELIRDGYVVNDGPTGKRAPKSYRAIRPLDETSP